MNNRILYVDALKAVSMLAVIISHVFIRFENGNCMLSFITAWDLPIFFMASGFFTKNISQLRFKTLCIKKSITLLFPYISFVFISSFFRGLDTLSVYFMNDGKGGLWFLPVLFVMFLLLYMISKISNTNSNYGNILSIIGGVLIAVIMLVLYLTMPTSWIGPSSILSFVVYWPYFFIGHVFAKINKYELMFVNERVASICALAFFAWWGGV